MEQSVIYIAARLMMGLGLSALPSAWECLGASTLRVLQDSFQSLYHFVRTQNVLLSWDLLMQIPMIAVGLGLYLMFAA